MKCKKGLKQLKKKIVKQWQSEEEETWLVDGSDW